MARVVEWTGPPQIDTGAPLPVLERTGDAAVVASVCRNGLSAVVRFSGVLWLHFGHPNDERLSEHHSRVDSPPA